MKKYKVIQSFFKISEQKNYAIGDIIELSDEDSKNMSHLVLAEKETKNKK